MWYNLFSVSSHSEFLWLHVCSDLQNYMKDSEVFQALPPQPCSTSPTLWRASISKSGSLPFKSTDARQPLYPSLDAINRGRLLYMLFPTPPMYSSPVRYTNWLRETLRSHVQEHAFTFTKSN